LSTLYIVLYWPKLADSAVAPINVTDGPLSYLSLRDRALYASIPH